MPKKKKKKIVKKQISITNAKWENPELNQQHHKNQEDKLLQISRYERVT